MNIKARRLEILRHFACWKNCFIVVLLAIPQHLHAEWGVNFQTTYIKSSLINGTYPYALVSGDFNGDGQVDLAVANAGGDHASGQKAQSYVSILINGGGNFSAMNDIPTGFNTAGIAAGDFNKDGKLDLAVSCEQAVDVLIGMGDGAFKKGSNATAIVDTRLQGLAAVDLDQDGKLDLMAAHESGGFAYLLAGRGDGIFSSMRTRWTFSPGAQPMSMVSGLFNLDPRPDFAVTIPNKNQVAICLNATTWATSTIPVVLSVAGAQNSFYTSEMTITNRTNYPMEFQFNYRSSMGGGEGSGSNMLGPKEQKIIPDAIQTSNHTATLSLQLQPAEQRLIPDFVQYLRTQGVAGIGPAGSTLAGAVFATLPVGDPALGQGLFMSARTSIAGDGGHYGLHYPAVPEGQTAKTAAWLYGLQQNDENRTNLALINTGEDDDSANVFDIEIYDGALATKVQTLEGITVNARQWKQLNNILAQAPDTLQGYARVVRTSGTNPFIAYAVINDGGTPHVRSDDGAYIAMQGAE